MADVTGVGIRIPRPWLPLLRGAGERSETEGSLWVLAACLRREQAPALRWVIVRHVGEMKNRAFPNEVQEYFKNPMGLYMAVAFVEIKKPEVGNAPTLTVTDEAATHLFPGSVVSLQYLFSNVNRDVRQQISQICASQGQVP